MMVKIYKDDCGTLPVSPLYDEDEDEMNLLTIYQPPSLYHVPYLRTHEKEGRYPISSYNELFCKDERSFRKLYVTGDAGVGKTSFCKRMSLLWCMSKSGGRSSDKGVQADIDFISQFDFVFHVSLRDTQKKDIVAIILEQLFSCDNDRKTDAMYESISNILSKYKCIIIMDALDEWTPSECGKININRLYSDRCTFVTTCRPFKLENERLTTRDIDRHVQMMGISKKSTSQYVSEIVNRLNKANGEYMDPVDFIREIKKCRLIKQIRIPIIASHLIAVWFDHKLTNMSRALIYSNIVDMLLYRAKTTKSNRAEKTHPFVLPDSPPESSVQLPESLSKLFNLNIHGALLKRMGILSFNILFKQDKCLSDLVFTTEQLASKPYSVSTVDINFLCSFGILSKHKIIGKYTKREQKLSFIHKTYLEYFAALFVASFDSNAAFNDVVKKWHSVDDVVQYETFFCFLVGFSCEKSETVFHDISHSISDYIQLHVLASNQLRSLQNMVLSCFKEAKQSHNPNMSLKLEHFLFGKSADSDDDVRSDHAVRGDWFTYGGFDSFDDDLSYDSTYGDNLRIDTILLKELLLLNKTCVRSIKVECVYFTELDEVQGLQSLYIHDYCLDDMSNKFTTLMLNNASTLNTVCIAGIKNIRGFTMRNLRHLTSLSLCHVSMHHTDLHNLVEDLSNNVNMETIELYNVTVDDDVLRFDNEHSVTLSLYNHAKLSKLCMMKVPIVCHNVNISSLKHISLEPISEDFVKCYPDLFNSIAGSQIECLDIYCNGMLDDCTLKTLMAVVNTMSCIKTIHFTRMVWTDDVFLHLHSGVEHVDMRLELVHMSSQAFRSFIDNIVHNKSVVEVTLLGCSIISWSKHSIQCEYVKYDYLATKPTIKITPDGPHDFQFTHSPISS